MKTLAFTAIFMLALSSYSVRITLHTFSTDNLINTGIVLAEMNRNQEKRNHAVLRTVITMCPYELELSSLFSLPVPSVSLRRCCW